MARSARTSLRFRRLCGDEDEQRRRGNGNIEDPEKASLERPEATRTVCTRHSKTARARQARQKNDCSRHRDPQESPEADGASGAGFGIAVEEREMREAKKGRAANCRPRNFSCRCACEHASLKSIIGIENSTMPVPYDMWLLSGPGCFRGSVRAVVPVVAGKRRIQWERA